MKKINLIIFLLIFCFKAGSQCPIIVPTVNDTCIIGSSSVTLTASGSSGNYAWYDALVGGNFLASGTSYTTPVISSNTNFYVAAQGDNGGLDFDGINDRVAIQTFNYNSSGIQEVTVEAWVKTTKTGGQIISSYDRSDYWRLGIGSTGSSSGKVSWSLLTNSGILDFGGSISVNDGVWHHVAGVYDNGLASIYVDGVLDATANLGTTFGSGNTRYGYLAIGSEATGPSGSTGPSQRFQGQMDEFRIWNIAKSQTDIQNSMNICLIGNEPNLELYYQFEDGTGSGTVTDVAIGNTGNLLSMSTATDWIIVDYDYSCPSCESARDQSFVQVSMTGSLSISGNDNSACTGSNLVLDAGSGFGSYLWNTGETTQTISANSSGMYYVGVVTGVCSATDSVTVELGGHSAQNNLDFDGTNDYAAITNFFYNSSTITELSVEAWVKTSNSGNQIIASFDRSDYWRLGINGDGAAAGRVAWNLNTSGGILDMGSVTRVDDGNWHHVAGTYDNGLASIYIDGELDISLTMGTTIGSGNTRFGFVGVGSEASTYNGPRGPSYYFNGEIDELRVWNKSLTEVEIKSRMCQSFSYALTDLDFMLNFNEGTGLTTFDPSSTVTAILKNTVPTIWTVSSAPLGDTSAYVYPLVNWAGETVSLTSCSGDEITVSNVTGGGTLEGIHVYVVEDDPNIIAGMTELTNFNHYFGVFQIDGGNSPFDVEYNYANHPLVGPSNEPSITLVKRNTNASTLWTPTSAVLDVPQQKLNASSLGTKEFILDSKEFIWTGAVDTDWNTAGNWTPTTVPPTFANIRVPNVTNQPILDMDRTITDLSIGINSTVDLAGLQLSMMGNLTHDGLILSNGGTLHFNGVGTLQQIDGNVPMTIDNMIVDNPDDVINVDRNVSITNTLTVLQGYFITNDSLTLVSNASGTARIDEILGDGIQGEISMERYIDAGDTYYRFFSSAVQGATIADYNDDFTTSGYSGSLFPNFPFTSIYTYDEGNDYVGVSNANQIINVGEGLIVWSGDTITGTDPFVVDLRGVPNQGDIIMPVSYTTGDGWNLVGNPYASTIDWDSPNWNKNRISDAIYILNPDTEQYATYINGASTLGGSPLIASQQAFWVVATTGTGSPLLEATESIKSTVDQAFFKAGGGISPGMHITIQGFNKHDECVMRHVAEATDEFDDNFDAYKRFSNWDDYPHISLLNTELIDLTIHSFNKAYQEWSIPLRTIVFESGDYDILFTDVDELNVPCLKLEDMYTGQLYVVEDGVPLTFAMSDTSIAPRFILHVGKDYDIVSESVSCFEGEDGSITVEFDQVDNGNAFMLTGSSGSTQNGVISNSQIIVNQLTPGAYNLTVNGLNNLCQINTFSIQIDQPLPLDVTAIISDEVNGNDGQIEIAINGGTPPYTYNWQWGATTNVDAAPIETLIFENLPSGSYQLTVSDYNGCQWFETFMVNNVLGTNEFLTANSEPVFFYNASEKIIYMDGRLEGNWELYSITGQFIKSVFVNSGQNQYVYKVPEQLPAGVYFIKFEGAIFRFVY